MPVRYHSSETYTLSGMGPASMKRRIISMPVYPFSDLE